MPGVMVDNAGSRTHASSRSTDTKANAMSSGSVMGVACR
jgi:hypothetical protein